MNYQKLSKEISYALRHAPWEYELELDNEGWVPIKQLFSSLNQSKEWEGITEKDIELMISLSDKKRHELNNSKIRALYGHSIPMKIIKNEVVPPKILFHGTSPDYINSIKEKGLLPMSRQYVHLSEDIETAKLVGKRKNSQPVILIIDAEKASSQGVTFYFGNEKVWLSDSIPANYLSIMY
ncbi:RNA 2'-phosphotransferase [Bacillus sp. XF8]|uniref:RNA 2'-phosphotransferase n=1 Tax=Bacillus sp. XF8 TaxID=2819289 RepID=UPI001AA01866|nr:RNA 2'-phosphotransferase [Bacillus sp. XF8]MBO1580105.1 RNA 2'-phosphotransferase [Bacillus sp. XF8]